MRVATLLGRADLLRAWKEADASASARLASLCGFQAELRTLKLRLKPDKAQTQAGRHRIATPEDTKAPLHARLFQAWVEEVEPIAATPPEQQRPVARKELLPPNGARIPAPPPLVRTPRLWPALQRSLGKTVPGEVDVASLVRRLSQGRRVGPLPFKRARVPATPLAVIWDDAERLMPYEQDCVQIIKLIERLRGSDFTLYTRHESFGAWSRWDGCKRDKQVRLMAPPKLSSGSVLLLSDLGALASSPWCEQQWLRQIKIWGKQGAQVVAWLPTLPGQVAADVARVAAIHHLSQAGGLRAQIKGWRVSEQRARAHRRLRVARDRLLVLASCAVHVAPELLRALRVLDPDVRSQPAAEGLAWVAAEVGSSLLSRPLGAEWAPRYRQEFSKLSPALQRSVIDALQKQHVGHGKTTPAIEWLLWQSHTLPAAQSPETATQVAAARDLLRRLARTGAGELPEADIRAFAQDIVHRLGHDQRLWSQEGELGGALYHLTQSERVPSGLDAAHVLSGSSASARVYLAQRRSGLWLMPESQALPTGQRLCAAFEASELVIDTLVPAPSGQMMTLSTHWRIGAEPVRLLKKMQAARVRTKDRSIEISDIPRPAWAHEFGRDSKGVYAMSPPLGIFQERFDARLEAPGRNVSFVSEGRWQKRVHLSNKHKIPDLSYAIGVDHRYGVYANIRLGDATQRFRWIAPGEFWMGSTDAERARITDKDFAEWARNEAPRHRVQLTRGYWIADTPCTQAFWFALMQGNPSDFKDKAEHPVEFVSWDDIQPALNALTALLPEACEADLPTEAEWEYACRAGTSTAFSGGDGLTAAQARFFGADAFGRSGDEFETAKVASYPANPWGLFDMHGNVWEWCRDGLREYQGVDELDPEGPQGISSRAARGGSWIGRAQIARCASRGQDGRGSRYRALGFRVALRSRSQGALPEAVPESAPEAPTTARRDAGPSLRERVQPLTRPKKGKKP